MNTMMISEGGDVQIVTDFRHEAAKDILCALIASEGNNYRPEDKEGVCRAAVEVADELIKQLNEK